MPAAKSFVSNPLQGVDDFKTTNHPQLADDFKTTNLPQLAERLYSENFDHRGYYSHIAYN